MALACVGLATLVRILAMPVLHDRLPFITYFPAVLLASVWGGWVGGGLVVMLTPLVVGFVVGEPHDHYTLDAASLIAFVIAAGLMVLVGSALARTARAAAEARAQSEAAEAQLRSLVAELAHRAKNGLGVMMAIVQQSARQAASIDDYRERILARLTAMSASQDLVTQSRGQPVNLAELLRVVLDPFDLSRFEIANAAAGLQVTPDTALGLALVFHELATNAVKYGSLTAHDGRVGITCAAGTDVSEAAWREHCGPPVTPPTTLGFGGRLFAMALRAQGGQTDVTYDPAGLRCSIKFRATPARA
jgi:two-component sensor histidine kinase